MSQEPSDQKKQLAAFLLRQKARELGQVPIPREGLSATDLQQIHKELMSDVAKVFPELAQSAGQLRSGIRPGDLHAVATAIGSGRDGMMVRSDDCQKIARAIAAVGTAMPFGREANSKFAEVIGQKMATTLGVKLNHLQPNELEDALAEAKRGRTAKLTGLVSTAIEKESKLTKDGIPILTVVGGSTVAKSEIAKVQFDSSKITMNGLTGKLAKMDLALEPMEPKVSGGMRMG